MNRFINKVALVTGGSGGIGKVIASRLAQEGAAVGVLARGKGAVESVVQEITLHRGRATALLADVRKKEELADALQGLLSIFGGKIDILINAAGIYKRTPLEDISLESWNETISTNVTGSFLMSQLVAEIMKKQGRGKIVNISSISAHISNSSPDYSASKAAIGGLTRSLATLLAPFHINVNAVMPGPTDTEMLAIMPSERREKLVEQIPLKRLATPDDVASAVLFLASDEASYITGSSLDVNGGLNMR